MKVTESNMRQLFPLLFFSEESKKTVSCSCGDGWYGVVVELFEKLVGTGVKVCQLKEKFGYLSVYVNTNDEHITKMIIEASDKAAKICEMCGSNDSVERRDVGFWLKTVCFTCFDKYTKEINNEEES